MKISTISHSLISLALVTILLIFGKDLFIPFILSLIGWFLIKTIRNSLLKISFFSKIPAYILTIASGLLIFLCMAMVIKLLTSNIQELSKSLPIYEKHIDSIIQLINGKFNVDVAVYLKSVSQEFNYSALLKGIFNSLSSVFSNTFMIILYTLFLLFEEKVFMTKLAFIYPKKDDFTRAESVISKIDNSISSYITLKTLVSLLTGFASFIVLSIIGVDAPLFWAFLIFLMNYIPTIGSLIATAFPAIFALLQFGTLAPFFWVLGGVGLIQVIVGNILEPKIMGNSLNISSLVVLITLSLWGAVWGITGMILSVPITVMMIIILSEIPSTKNIAILLSEKGEI